jgi:multicomponent Na+:H+ antiporter subunit D
MERNQWPVLVAMLVSSLLALVYVGRIVEVAWFREPVALTEPRKPPASMVAAIWVLVLVSVYFGLDATLPATLADAAADALLGTGGE